ncbi:hypothetical protein GAH_01418 [Geoglobus ahangari]|uniref:Uncharacterized protein n=1 Tax=Geoglobus ahangari TaxID=113653 RepID=A0A0F7IH36_9EURY|nr:hypothetical protein [Geoglobus ahangari]AKG91288.1 hypothetical protein GAH_01418 [Geoglobus ahangari]
MAMYLEPIKVLVYNDRAIPGEESSGFGGFCSCGGEMSQRTWHRLEDLRILVSECESCWNTEALVFRETELVERVPVRVFKRNELRDFLSEVLSPAEFEAVMEKRRNGNYNYTAYSRAKKKLESLGLDVEKIISELIF